MLEGRINEGALLRESSQDTACGHTRLLETPGLVFPPFEEAVEYSCDKGDLIMSRFFNTAGPCDAADHYMLPTAHRLPEVRLILEQKTYFVLHAPRQVGKTTTLINLAQQLTAEGTYASVLVSMEVGAAFPEDIGAAEDAMLEAWRRSIETRLPAELQPPP